MKLSLARLDAEALNVELPGDQRVAVHSASRLIGELESAGERLAIPRASAERVVLDALALRFGDLSLTAAARASLDEVVVSLESSGHELVLDVKAASVTAQELGIVTRDVLVRGKVTLVGAKLAVNGEEGSLAAERVELTGFGLRVGELEIAADALSGTAVAIAWGAAGFRLAAQTLETPSLGVGSGDARVTASSVAVGELSLNGGDISAGRLSAGRGHVEIVLAQPPAPATPKRSSRAPEPVKPAEPLLDWSVLDGLSGEIDVDVAVDLTVPIIGSRKATHRLRVPIEHGAIDYRELESNLAHLENALLDFSVRDGALVLERVNPLFPARGHGKPIVVWDLPPSEVALAENHRVRLAVLPGARLAGSDDDAPPESSSGSSIALRKLDFLRIGVKLALAPRMSPLRGQLRPLSIGSLVLQGNVFHAEGESPRTGTLLGELRAISAAVSLPLGDGKLDLAHLDIAGVSPIEVTFADVRPTKVQLDFAGMTLQRVSLLSRPG